MSKTSQEVLSSPVFSIGSTTSRSTYRVGQHETTLFRLGWVFVSLVFCTLIILGFALIFSAKAEAADLDSNKTTVAVPKLDSDKDGILDFYEINVYGTDPTKADTDGDGFHDDMELMWGHDPLNSNPKAKYLLSTFSPFLRTSDAYISRHLTVKGSLIADDEVKIADELKVLGQAKFSQNATFGGKLDLQGSLYNSKGIVSIKDPLKVSSKITAKNLKVTNKITTKNLRVTSNMTVEDMTLRRGGKNRAVVGTNKVGGEKPLISTGFNPIAGYVDCNNLYGVYGGTNCSYIRNAGTVRFQTGVKFKQHPMIFVQYMLKDAMLQGRQVTEIYDSSCDTSKGCGDMALLTYVSDYILENGQVVGFTYQVRKPQSENYAHVPTVDLTPSIPIVWTAIGNEVP